MYIQNCLAPAPVAYRRYRVSDYAVGCAWSLSLPLALQAGQFAEKSSSPLRAQHGTSEAPEVKRSSSGRANGAADYCGVFRMHSENEVLVWHCKHPHGLFSMFSLALGHMETCEKTGTALIVDWCLPYTEKVAPPRCAASCWRSILEHTGTYS